MENYIEEILRNINPGCYFDSHYVVQRLITDNSDEYLRFAAQYAHSNEPTLTCHQQIGHQIARFEGSLVERQNAQSWSMNIHGKASTCALWTRCSGATL